MSEATAAGVPPRLTLGRWLAGLAIAAIAWVAAYRHLTDIADVLVAAIGLQRGTHFAEAMYFFLYDTPKVLLLLVGIVFLMGVLQTFFAPERTRALLAGKRTGIGNVLAATLGIVTPFCSCSAVPLFIGFLSAGVPMGVTFSFLNSIPLALLFFNVGVEIGQLIFIAVVLVLLAAGTRVAAAMRLSSPAWLWRVPPYAIGGLASYWVFERVAGF